MSNENYKYIIGIDEVGRGPLAGPVMVAAFAVEVKNQELVLEKLTGITDSKKLTEKRREKYVEIIKKLQKQELVHVAVSSVSAHAIDRNGIVPAINSALKNSLKKLNINSSECFVYLDGGLHAPGEYAQETIIKGDSKIWHIGAASVVAKVTRDRKMVHYAQQYSEYGFESHKGYATKKHKNAIAEYGTCDIHRKTWIH